MYFQKPFLAVFGRTTECYRHYGDLTSDGGGRRTRVDKIWPAIPESFYVTIWSMLGSIFWKRLVSTNSRLGIQGLWLKLRAWSFGESGPWIPYSDRVMLTMSVIITGSLLNMIMNEIEHGKWIMRVGRDTIDLSWIVVVIQSEASVFIFEALLIGWLLKTFCSRVQYSIYHSDFPIEGRVRWTADRPDWLIYGQSV